MIKDQSQQDESEDELEAEQGASPDPFLRAGYGANAYFDIQYSIIKLFIFITILLLPVMYLNY